MCGLFLSKNNLIAEFYLALNLSDVLQLKETKMNEPGGQEVRFFFLNNPNLTLHVCKPLTMLAQVSRFLCDLLDLIDLRDESIRFECYPMHLAAIFSTVSCNCVLCLMLMQQHYVSKYV